MSFRDKARVKADMISRMNSVGMELRGKETTVADLEVQIYSLNKKINTYEIQLKKTDSKAIMEMYQKSLDLFTAEKDRLVNAAKDLYKSIDELTLKFDELKSEIKNNFT